MIAHVVLGCFWFWLHVHMSWQPNLRPHSGLIPHHGPAPRGPQDSGVVRSLVGCLSEGDSALLRVTSVVYSSACSDSTYTGRHLLCPLLVTMLAKSRSQTESTPTPGPPSPPPPPHRHPRADRHYFFPPVLCGLSDVEGFDQNCLRQGRREEHRGWGYPDNMTWRATEAEAFAFVVCIFYIYRWE